MCCGRSRARACAGDRRARSRPRRRLRQRLRAGHVLRHLPRRLVMAQQPGPARQPDEGPQGQPHRRETGASLSPSQKRSRTASEPAASRFAGRHCWLVQQCCVRWRFGTAGQASSGTRIAKLTRNKALGPAGVGIVISDGFRVSCPLWGVCGPGSGKIQPAPLADPSRRAYTFSTDILVCQNIYFCSTITTIRKTKCNARNRLLPALRLSNSWWLSPLSASSSACSCRRCRRCGRRVAARNARNNLKQIGLALLNFESDYGAFPNAFRLFPAPDPAAPSGTGSYGPSAFVLILPYLE